MAPTRKCRALSWDVGFQPELTSRSRAEGREESTGNMVLPLPDKKKGVPCAATRTCMRGGVMANLRHDVQNATRECARNTRFSTSARSMVLHLPDNMKGVPCAATRTCMRRGAMASLRHDVKHATRECARQMPPESVQSIRFSAGAPVFIALSVTEHQQ